MKCFSFSWLLILLLSGWAHSANAQEPYFRITSFTLNGETVKNFTVTFEVKKKTIIPRQGNDTVFVPNDVREAGFVAIVFQTPGFHFKFEPLGFTGYTESDPLKVDFSVDIDTPPFELKNGTAKELRNVCAVYSLTSIPRFSESSHSFADPLTFMVRERCTHTSDTTCDKSCMRTMRDLIKMKKAGMGTTWLEKANFRLGDSVADGVTKSFPGTKIFQRANIQMYLSIIHVAFEAPGMIQIPQNRKPVATIRMLNKVRKAATDEPSRKEISDLIDWLNSLET